MQQLNLIKNIIRNISIASEFDIEYWNIYKDIPNQYNQQ